jgi:hypothetical protein
MCANTLLRRFVKQGSIHAEFPFFDLVHVRHVRKIRMFLRKLKCFTASPESVKKLAYFIVDTDNGTP